MPPTNVLITGGTGFVGTAIIEALLSLPSNSYIITALDLNPPSLGTKTFPQVKYVRANVLSREDLKRAFEEARPDVVLHTAGAYSLGTERYSVKGKAWNMTFEVNVEGTRNVVETCKETGVGALIYTSSITVLSDELDKDCRNADETWSTGRATTAYGQSKTMAENLILAANTPSLKTCSLRPSPIFGPNDPTTIPILHSCINKWETPFILGSGENLQDYVYVSNVADAHVLAAQNLLSSSPTAAGETFFITNGEPVPLRDICIAVWKEFDHVPLFEVRIPESLAWWFGWGGECWNWISGSKGNLSRGVVLDATKDRFFSIEKARRVLEYEPRVNLTDAIRISCADFKRRFKAQVKT